MPATPSISLDHDPISFNRTMISSLFEHDLFENRVCAFLVHALERSML